MRTREDVRTAFTYQPPSPAAKDLHSSFGLAFRTLALRLHSALPETPARTIALRSLATARMEANAAIALGISAPYNASREEAEVPAETLSERMKADATNTGSADDRPDPG